MCFKFQVLYAMGMEAEDISLCISFATKSFLHGSQADQNILGQFVNCKPKPIRSTSVKFIIRSLKV